MPQSNFERMIALANEFFDVKNDPEQLSVTAETMEKLRALHPTTLSEEADENGPVAWILIIPTTAALMQQFVAGEITENDLLERTPVNGPFETIYLCSALVLPEYRGKGIAKRLTIDAIQAVRRDHPITALFAWPFSPEGDALAASIANHLGLPLRERKRHTP